MSELEGMLRRQGEEGYRTGVQEEVRRPLSWWSWSWSWWSCQDFSLCCWEGEEQDWRAGGGKKAFVLVVLVLVVSPTLFFMLLGERGAVLAYRKR